MKDKKYRELEQELQTILDRIEHAGYEDLEELLKDHASGEKLIEEMQTRLDLAKAHIKKVSPDT